ncbi:MAG: hypothetical protein PHS48_09485 [Bacteroidales bacterium]|nr:hypothetical protein [Bacteroidales bacterium]
MSKDKINSEHRYFQIPICWNQKILANPKNAINQAICFGIWYYANNIKNKPGSVDEAMQPDNAARQVLYDYYNHQDRINTYLLKKLREYHESGRISEKDESRGFGFDGFSPEPQESDMLDLFNKDLDFMAACILHENLHRADHFFGYEPNPKLTQINAKPVENFQQEQEQLHGAQPLTMCKRVIMERFMDQPDDIELLLAYLGIKSLIGRKTWQRTTKLAVISRMIGAKNAEALKWVLENNPQAKAIYQHYFDNKGTIRRHRFDKLIHRLQDLGFLKSYFGKDRSIYLSFTLDMRELTDAIISLESDRNHRAKEREARERIRQRIQKPGLN